jgi:hypothetical protein
MNMADCTVRALEDDTGFIDASGSSQPWSAFPDYLKSKIKFGATVEVNPKAGMAAWQEAVRFIKKQTADDSDTL